MAAFKCGQDVSMDRFVAEVPGLVCRDMTEDDALASYRGASFSKSCLVELWATVVPTPGPEATQFFMPNREAEHALHRLETAHPSWVFAQLAACCASLSVFVLRQAAGDPCLYRADQLSSVRGAVATVEAAATKATKLLLQNVRDHDLGWSSATPGASDPGTAQAVDWLIESVAAAETHLARAVSLLRRCAPPGKEQDEHAEGHCGLVEDLLQNVGLRATVSCGDSPARCLALLRLLHSFEQPSSPPTWDILRSNLIANEERPVKVDLALPPPDKKDALVQTKAVLDCNDPRAPLVLHHTASLLSRKLDNSRYETTSSLAIERPDAPLAPRLA
mmetsp:Transcript_8695/g.35839  ORF Transcript_8695/g.35839 Transcript_8695/m.35839 type:complete len:333 (+) Transcript_8695:2098-3096(+)